MSKVEISVSLRLREATRQDILSHNNVYRYGTMYFIRSQETGQFDKQPYYIRIETNKIELNKYLRNKQIFVTIRHFDDTEVIITPIHLTKQTTIQLS